MGMGVHDRSGVRLGVWLEAEALVGWLHVVAIGQRSGVRGHSWGQGLESEVGPVLTELLLWLLGA